ncbi:hypothetical protein KEH51_05200 [[Brevibacterium] frigoritolerans]|uniref:ParB/Sulfiredoxin domain-containing protein n=1 Tax=Peribacillus frigoritolerans TaxID=450367 RepID=A0A941J671_9BACI|nr:hypothetical protein [Peribacillus frigoritolerans]
MKKLKEAVTLNDWDNQYANTLSLIQIPSGEFVVTPGGNHRAMLAKELGLTSIEASVHRIFPISVFPSNVINKVKELHNEAAHILEALSKLRPEDKEAFDLLIRLDEIQLGEINQTFLNYLLLNNLG